MFISTLVRKTRGVAGPNARATAYHNVIIQKYYFMNKLFLKEEKLTRTTAMTRARNIFEIINGA